MKKCSLCEFETDNKKTFANHIRWKHKEKPFSEEGRKRLRTRTVPKIKRNCVCPKCETLFERELLPSDWRKIDKLQGGRTYCSEKCAHSRDWNKESAQELKKQISVKLKNFYRENRQGPNRPRTRPLISNICKICSKAFEHKLKRIFCSKECYDDSRKRKTKDLAAYRNECKFRFSLNQFPNEFDFDLIREHGMYKASNRGGSSGGVSRDHMVSVKYGFLNGIDPAIIRHPANCRLILQSENFKKRDKCSMTLDELLIKIIEWDKKYPEILSKSV